MKINMTHGIVIAAVLTFISGAMPVSLGSVAYGAETVSAQTLSKPALTDKEKAWLKTAPVMRLGIDPAWQPIEYLDTKGELRGISSDYLKIISQELGLKFEVSRLNWAEAVEAAKHGKIDMFACISNTPQRSEYLNFTRPYLKMPIVVYTLNPHPYVYDFAMFKGQKVVVQRNTLAHEKIARDYPEIHLVPVEKIKDAFDILTHHQAVAFVDSIATGSYYLAKLGYTNIKINGQTPYYNDSSMGVRKDWPIAVGILQKVLDSIPEKERDVINQRWIFVKYEHGFNYTLVYQILIVGLVILCGIVYWNRRLSRKILIRAKAEKALEKHKGELEKVVEELNKKTKELEEARRRSEETNRAKSAFLANMSHELRTPLNAVIGFSQLMKNASDIVPDQRENLDIITRSGEHLLDLINNVLDISKIEAGRVELEESPLDLHQLMQEITSLMSVRAHEKGLDFIQEHPPDLIRHIAADGGKLRQILLNLIGNAIKYTTQGGVTLRIVNMESELVDVPNAPQSHISHLTFEIEDTGPGIRKEDRERIFDLFVQLEDRPFSGTGSGLGLALCKQYADLMGGTIRVGGEPGKGAVFQVEIPVMTIPSAALPVEARRGRVMGLVEGQPRYRLLIAEDQPENRLLLRKLLEPFDFELREAVNGQEAVDVFEQWHPHLIWMDTRLPIMNGLDATRRIKTAQGGGDTRIVALTAHALEEERKEIMAVGCDDFIRKPYKDVEIFDALTTHLGVRFVYEDATLPAAGAALLDAADLADLPDKLLDALEQGLVRLDIDLVNRAIDDIRSSHSSVADALAAVAGELQFGRMLRIIRAAGTTDPEDEPCITH